MPDVPAEEDDVSPLSKCHHNTVQYSRHDDIDDDYDEGNDTNSASDEPSGDEQDESENDDNDV